MFGVGLPKSGTRSLGETMKALGYVPAKGMVGKKSPGSVHYRFNGDLLPFVRGKFAASNPLAHLLWNRTWRGATFYSDFPFYALPCELARRYPAALFVNVERECGGWTRSALRQLSCMWLKRGCNRTKMDVDTPESKNAHAEVGYQTTKWYFDQIAPGAMASFCAQREALCFKDHGWRYNETMANETGLTAKYEALCAEHAGRVEACVPRERLLTLKLETDASEVQKLLPFLGCEQTDRGTVERTWAKMTKVWTGQSERRSKTGAAAARPTVAGSDGETREPEAPKATTEASRERRERRNHAAAKHKGPQDPPRGKPPPGDSRAAKKKGPQDLPRDEPPPGYVGYYCKSDGLKCHTVSGKCWSAGVCAARRRVLAAGPY